MLRRRVLLPDHVELAGMLPVARYVGRMERIEGRGEQGEVTQPRGEGIHLPLGRVRF